MPFPKFLFSSGSAGLATPTAQLIDFAKSPLKSYYSQPHPFALLIDNIFTSEECESLLALAQSGKDKWESALINSWNGQQVLATGVRDCTRIMKDDFDTAGWIYERIKPYLEEVMVIGKGSDKWRWIAGYQRVDDTTSWEMTRLNERLRFLRYTKDQFFKPHFDGSYITPDRTEASFLTLHLYLNSTGSIFEPGTLGGGATRFLAPDGSRSKYLDVEAKQGRVLIFQHAMLLHSGEKVTSGVKYTMRTDIMYRVVVEKELRKDRDEMCQDEEN